MEGKDTWDEWKKFVLSKLEELQKDINDQSKSFEDKNDKIMTSLNNIRLEILTLKIKSGLWGAFAGGLSAAVAAVLALMK